MNEITQYLEKLGLSEEESNLYSLLLQTGPISIRDLAIKAGIKRTTAYLYIDLLIDKGLVIKVVKGSQKLVSAENPEKSLKDLVDQKQKAANELENKFPEVLKTLALSVTNQIPPEEAEIKYYKGRSGVKKIYEEVLKAKEQRSYVDMEKIADIFPENFELFSRVYVNNPDIKMFEIFQNTPSFEFTQYIKEITKNKNYLYKFLPNGIKLISQDIIIYENKVAIISYQEGINALLLCNNILYNNFKALFDVMWQLLPQPEK